MIVDTSAIIAILFEEPEADVFVDVILGVNLRTISAGNFLEASIVITGRGFSDPRGRLDELVDRLDLEVAPVTWTTVDIARQAFMWFGRGRHPAKLNFGDCFAYALAKETGRPLLFKGDDFSRTDIEPAIAP